MSSAHSPSLPLAGSGGSKPGRLGCFGCLGKIVLSLAGTVFLGFIGIVATEALFNPWSFYMGGRFHLVPGWRGWGKIQSASGRPYFLYAWFEPVEYKHNYSGVPHVQGWGTLCTPAGAKYDLRLTGGLEKHMGSSTDGKRMTIYLHRRPWYYTFVGTYDSRPQLEFHGVWHNPDLVLDDGGSLDRAFNADGTLHSGPSPARKSGQQGAQLILREGGKSEFEAACRESPGR
jgi:hypothetical protein